MAHKDLSISLTFPQILSHFLVTVLKANCHLLCFKLDGENSFSFQTRTCAQNTAGQPASFPAGQNQALLGITKPRLFLQKVSPKPNGESLRCRNPYFLQSFILRIVTKPNFKCLAQVRTFYQIVTVLLSLILE